MGMLIVATGLVAGFMWTVGWMGTWSPERDTQGFTLVVVPIAELMAVSTIAWLAASLIAGVRAWRSIDEASWLQRFGWGGLVAAGFTGLIPLLVGLGGGYLALSNLWWPPPVGGGEGVWMAILWWSFLTGGGATLLTLGGALVPDARRRFRAPVLAGFVPGLAAGLASTLDPPWLWGVFTVVGVPVAALALWPVYKQEDGGGTGVTGGRYVLGTLVMWSGLATIAVALISGAGYLVGGG